ncbi:unnamed protein product [Mycena citricolor]|uniref:Protein kinase domain-containing protein n=1 Tax=Mycena citricolor TaxID=2018698 RepID=A0AAD2GZF2_9AGAR|nr:unnamed protein product [Mycena citricolor]
MVNNAALAPSQLTVDPLGLECDAEIVWGSLELTRNLRPPISLSGYKAFVIAFGPEENLFTQGVPRYLKGEDYFPVFLPGPDPDPVDSHPIIRWNGRQDSLCAFTLTNCAPVSVAILDGAHLQPWQSVPLVDGAVIEFVPSGYRYTFRVAFRQLRRHLVLKHHYEIVGQLGQGAFGAVCKVRDRRDGKLYAFKYLHKASKPHCLTRRMDRECAYHEMMALKTIGAHPNIVKLIQPLSSPTEIGYDLLLELIHGITLLEYVGYRGCLSEDHSRNLTYQLCSGLVYIHGLGVSHGDIKYNNILLALGDHQQPVIKIIDFGLARIKAFSMYPTKISSTSFNAPEVFHQEHSATFAQMQLWDSWALGYMVYFMLTGSHPFVPHDGPFDPNNETIDWLLLEHVGVSVAAYSFVRQLLRLSYPRRLQIRHTLKQPWFQDFDPAARIFGRDDLPPALLGQFDAKASGVSAPVSKRKRAPDAIANAPGKKKNRN